MAAKFNEYFLEGLLELDSISPLVCACAGWSGTATVPEPAGHYAGSKRTLGHLSLQLCTLP